MTKQQTWTYIQENMPEIVPVLIEVRRVFGKPTVTVKLKETA